MAILTSLSRKVASKKAVFLDLDNTLYAYGPCHHAGLGAAFRYYRLNVERISRSGFLKAYHAARHIIHQRLKGQAASHSRLLYFQTLLETRFGKTQCRHTLKLEAVYWNAFLRRMRLHTWVKPFLRYCRRGSIKVLLVTNLTTAIQLQKIRKLGLNGLINFLVTSEEAGAEKPAPAIFKLALRKTKCSPREVLAAGDDPRSDRLPFADFERLARADLAKPRKASHPNRP